MTSQTLPAPVAKAGITRARTLDVRPVIERGGDPFRLIMTTIGELAADEALELIVGFEPSPLYAVLETMRYATWTEVEGPLFHVFIFRDPAAGGGATAPAGEARPPLQPPVEMDVRDLEPPKPMVAILEKLVALGPGAQLLVRHHREPHLLYDKLRMRGYAAHTERLPDGDFLVRVAPQWAFGRVSER